MRVYNPNDIGEIYHSDERMLAPFEPDTPCVIMETRACSKIVEPAETLNDLVYPVEQCVDVCARFDQPISKEEE